MDNTLPSSPTVELWFRVTSYGGVLLGQENSNDTQYVPILYVDTDGLLRGTFWSSSGVTPLTSASPLTVNTWHHAVLATVGATATSTASQTLYLDGQVVGAKGDGVLGLDMTRVNVGTGIGAGWPGSGCTGWCGINGSIGRVAFYDHPLGQAQVGTHYQAGLATLTGTTATTFTNPPAVVAGTLPAAPASTPQRVRVEYRNPTTTVTSGSFTLKATTGTTTTAVPASALSPRYGLPTWAVTDDTGGVTSAKTITATRYDGSGLDPQYGLATDIIADPTGLNLDTTTGYEPPATTGYLRRTTRALPSGAATAVTTSYYGDTEPRTNPCPGGVSANQAGRPKITTAPAPAAGTAVAVEAIYDAAGRVVAAHNLNDPSTAWACTRYDARGRTTSVTTPAIGADATAKTTTTSYGDTRAAPDDDPRITRVTNSVGTITTIIDLLGRVTSYTDTSGVSTTTSYDIAGRVTSSTSTAAAGGTSTVAYTYLDDGRVSTITVDGAQLASVGYDTTAEMSSVTYTSTGASVLTVGGYTKKPSGSPTGQTWTIGTRTLTETLTRSQARAGMYMSTTRIRKVE